MVKSEYELNFMIQKLESLYETDPDQFEDLRKKIINLSINSFPERHRDRARGIQFTLDCELNKYKNPVVRMNRMVELFWEKLFEFQEVVNDPISYSSGREENKKPGKVLPFRRLMSH